MYQNDGVLYKALVLQLDKDGGQAVDVAQLCATASELAVGGALTLGTCNPTILESGWAYVGWGNQTWVLPPTVAGGVIALSADTSLCWGGAGALQLVLCSGGPGKNGSHMAPSIPAAGFFSGLSNATASGGGGVALRSGSGKDMCVAAQGTDTEEEDYGKITPLVESTSIFTAVVSTPQPNPLGSRSL